MNTKPKFVYRTLIATTPEKLWAALTDPKFTVQYWGGTSVESDWQVGSRVVFRWQGKIVHDDTVLKSEPPRLLSYTFKPLHMEELRAEPASRVTFEIEEFTGRAAERGPVVRLTVTHEEFPADSRIFPMISSGWPDILSSLKSLLETGRAIEFKW
ncbi:MAG: SRPBCC family protein [Chthoniobacter sp.]|uniref:SRPBCC family protein n=1 Tax=Chthoniobacter sp. TaxID=2510640 RepID=UPI0032A794C3